MVSQAWSSFGFSELILVLKLRPTGNALKGWSTEVKSFENMMKNSLLSQIQNLDGKEEYCVLSSAKKDLIESCKEKPHQICKAKGIYWKQRTKVKWSTVRNKHIAFLHKTTNFRRKFNWITSTD